MHQCTTTSSPGGDKEAGTQRLGQRVTQPLGVDGRLVVEEAVAGGEARHLLLTRRHHMGMAVAHWRGARGVSGGRGRRWTDADKEREVKRSNTFT